MSRIWPGSDTGNENPARYIIRAAFSQERMRYVPASTFTDGRARVIYQSQDGRNRKVFFALDRLAQPTTPIHNRREHMVRACGFFRNKRRGRRKMKGEDDDINEDREGQA